MDRVAVFVVKLKYFIPFGLADRDIIQRFVLVVNLNNYPRFFSFRQTKAGGERHRLLHAVTPLLLVGIMGEWGEKAKALGGALGGFIV